MPLNVEPLYTPLFQQIPRFLPLSLSLPISYTRVLLCIVEDEKREQLRQIMLETISPVDMGNGIDPSDVNMLGEEEKHAQSQVCAMPLFHVPQPWQCAIA